ncbi:probable ubiquitin-conjugating enzyme E2 26 isoform X2 [Ricinus communis]|uniref:probable ubiquitin-conjugating enzyme E2 26 isoform X2 n=1 Tax=Ricinus communis TaxID=3988 RepID=UPI000772CDEB|nr:probable ubiquitin-conjugating enzyme E2 26 isoform X2 [Ricinus communis]|eukprot:XP_015573909.1 probable ubiquitin-conjugating enzyme E2 26 isoform X2 [Ricinus communis]
MNIDIDDQVSISNNLNQKEAVLFDAMDVERDVDEKADTSSKGKTKDSGLNASVAGSVDSNDHPKSSTSGSISLNNINGSLSDLSYHDDDDVTFDDDGGGADDYYYYYYDDDDEYLYEEEDYLAYQSQFDNVDLPAGVEASLPWLKEPANSGFNTPGTSTSTMSDPSESKRKSVILDIAETKRKATGSGLSENNSSAATTASSSNGEEIDNKRKGVLHILKNFKQFDTVEDFSDHHYCRMESSDKQRPDPRGWAKRIQEEWKILEKDLPDTISVRVYESRMELLRAVIVGPAGTPYHDGLFVFDCLFPSTYPNAPPMVYYYSGGLRLNPNLYECGKVCLSLLGTWSGKQTEMWIPGRSTMLQVLVSIQALILNAKPFFNEPGYETSYAGESGDKESRKYNEDVFILSLKTMMYTLRRPPKYFEDFVICHFYIRAHDILVACKAYLDGATVGTVAVKDGIAEINKAEMKASSEFRVTLEKTFNALITNFTKFGSIDCGKFQSKEADGRLRRV